MGVLDRWLFCLLVAWFVVLAAVQGYKLGQRHEHKIVSAWAVDVYEEGYQDGFRHAKMGIDRE